MNLDNTEKGLKAFWNSFQKRLHPDKSEGQEGFLFDHFEFPIIWDAYNAAEFL
jgi:hypothetical protein